MVSHLSRESCLPGTSISNCLFPNKEGIVWTMTSQDTQHIWMRELPNLCLWCFGHRV